MGKRSRRQYQPRLNHRIQQSRRSEEWLHQHLWNLQASQGYQRENTWPPENLGDLSNFESESVSTGVATVHLNLRPSVGTSKSSLIYLLLLVMNLAAVADAMPVQQHPGSTTNDVSRTKWTPSLEFEDGKTVLESAASSDIKFTNFIRVVFNSYINRNIKFSGPELRALAKLRYFDLRNSMLTYKNLVKLAADNRWDEINYFCKHWPNAYIELLFSEKLMRHEALREQFINQVATFNDDTHIPEIRITGSNIREQARHLGPQTLLHLSARFGDKTLMQQLINSDQVTLNLKNPNGDTALDIAIHNNDVEMAWLLIDAYIARGVTLTEVKAFEILSFFTKAYEEAQRGQYARAGRLVFFYATNNSTVSNSLLLIGLISILAPLIEYITRNQRKIGKLRGAFINKCLEHANLKPFTEGLAQYMQSCDVIEGYTCGISHAVLFPFVIAHPDGHSYCPLENASHIGTWLYDKSPLRIAIPDRFEFRLHINMMSYLRLKLIEAIDNDKELNDDIKKNYKDQLTSFAKKYELYETIDECFKDPKTSEELQGSLVVIGKDGRCCNANKNVKQGDYYPDRAFAAIISEREKENSSEERKETVTESKSEELSFVSVVN